MGGKLTIGTAQIQELISKLEKNGIEGTVIGDILEFQTKVGLFANEDADREDRNSDSGSKSSIIYDSDGIALPETEPERSEYIKKKILKRERNNEFPMYPEWFPDQSMFPKKEKVKEVKIDWRNDPNWIENNNFGFWKPPKEEKEKRVWNDPIKGLFKKKKKVEEKEYDSEEEAFSQWNFEH